MYIIYIYIINKLLKYCITMISQCIEYVLDNKNFREESGEERRHVVTRATFSQATHSS